MVEVRGINELKMDYLVDKRLFVIYLFEQVLSTGYTTFYKILLRFYSRWAPLGHQN